MNHFINLILGLLMYVRDWRRGYTDLSCLYVVQDDIVQASSLGLRQASTAETPSSKAAMRLLFSPTVSLRC